MGSNEHQLCVPEGVRKERADKIVCAAHPELSRAAVQRVFEEGLVRMRGSEVAIAKNHRVSSGEVVVYRFPPNKPAELAPNPIALEVLFEDEHLIAINKPAGMVVHPGAGTRDDTLVHALLAHCAGKLSGIGGVERPGIVHRLDRETSGVIVAAKTDRAHRRLARAFAARETGKEYLALVTGVPRLLSGVIDRPITRHSVHRHRMTIARDAERGREAQTDWNRVETFGDFGALLLCRIHTGRTHQIRVHLKSIGHVILGDATYGWRRDPRLPDVPRVMLHAARLGFVHPITEAPLELAAPLPADFRELLEALRSLSRG
jgi:23S rRNA pseudouridine1911/1915/1917 synthase